MTTDRFSPPTYYILAPATVAELEAVFSELLASGDPPAWLSPDERQWPLEVRSGDGRYAMVFDHDPDVDSHAEDVAAYLSTRFDGPVFVNGIDTDEANFVSRYEAGTRTDVLEIEDSWEFASQYGCEIPRPQRIELRRADAIVVEGVSTATVRDQPLIRDARDVLLRDTAHGVLILRRGRGLVCRIVDEVSLSEALAGISVVYLLFHGDGAAPGVDPVTATIYRDGEERGEYNHPHPSAVADIPLVNALFGATTAQGILEALGLDRATFLPWTSP